MPVVAAVVCPHPPLLVPELASGAAAELAGLRAACLAAVDRLATTSADELVIVGSAPGPTTRYAAGAAGSFGSYGAPQVQVRLGAGEPSGQSLPLSLLVGAWLVQQTGAAALPVRAVTVSPTATPADCQAVGYDLAHPEQHTEPGQAQPTQAGQAQRTEPGQAERTEPGQAERTEPGQAEHTEPRLALLVMGDGSARRSEHAPVHLHPRAELFDATVAAALARADRRTLAALDPHLAAELHAAGRAPWQVLAEAAAADNWRSSLAYDAAPYGVGYFVSSWER